MATTERDWTIMVYMAGDNNLSDNMAFSLDELDDIRRQRGTSSDYSNLLAFFDSSSPTVPTYYMDYSEVKPIRHEVTLDDLYHPRPKPGENQWRDPENSGTAYSILNFIRWCIHAQKRTAKNYVIIFSGHSFGFYGKSFLGDQSSGHYMTLRRLRWVIGESSRIYMKGNRLAIVGFDSCEMSMLEVGYELCEVAQTIVASEGNLPNSGWGYAPMLRGCLDKVSSGKAGEELDRASADPGVKSSPASKDDAPEHIVKVTRYFVKKFYEQQRKFAIGGRSVDMAAWDLDKIEYLTIKVGELGSALSRCLGFEKIRAGEELNKVEAHVFNAVKGAILQSRLSCQTYMHEQAVDLRDFCQYLRLETLQLAIRLRQAGLRDRGVERVSDLCREVINEFHRCVSASGFVGDVYQFSTGISLYFPWTARIYYLTDFTYSNLRFVCGYTKVSKDSIDGEILDRERPVPGWGVGWDNFLYFYLFFITLRRSRDKSLLFSKLEKGLLDGDIMDSGWEELQENWKRGRAHPDRPDGNWDEREDWRIRTREDWRMGTKEHWLMGTREDWRLGTKEGGREDWRRRTKEEFDEGSREDWRLGTKEGDNGSREDWRIGTKEGDNDSREDWRIGTKENGHIHSREDWRVRTREQMADDFSVFDQIKNYQMNWEVSGYADRFEGDIVNATLEGNEPKPPKRKLPKKTEQETKTEPETKEPSR